MKVDDTYLRSLEKRSLFIDERERELKGGSNNEPTISSSAATRLERWRFITDEFLGCEEEYIQDLISSREKTIIAGDTFPDSSQPLSNWVTVLKSILEEDSAFCSQEDVWSDGKLKEVFETSHPIPFEDVFLPFILYFNRRTRHLLGELLEETAEQKAYADVQRYVLRTLSNIAAPTLYLEFKASNFSQDREENISYTAFVESLLSDRYSAFFHEYPVLARFLVTITEGIINSFVSLIQRLDLDRNEISTHLKIDKESRLREIYLGLSDPHNNYQTVARLVFDNNKSIIYKPKEVLAETLFCQFANDLPKEAPTGLKGFGVINKEGYGWVEFVETLKCNSEDELSRFYFNAGSLLCLSYVFQTNDLHHENVIPHGVHPVLVDLETLLNSEFHQTANSEADVLHSVLSTGLLPTEVNNKNAISSDTSGFFAREYESRYPTLSFTDINTDKMTATYSKKAKIFEAHLPLAQYEKSLIPAFDRLNFIKGFRETYNYISENRPFFRRQIRAFGKARIRVVLRSTSMYFRLQQRLYQPKYMRSGLDYSIELDSLLRVVSTSLPEYREKYLGAVLSEQAFFQAGDIPYFFKKSQSLSLLSENMSEIEDMFSSSGVQRAIRCIDSLGRSDYKVQLSLIYSSLHLRDNNWHKRVLNVPKRKSSTAYPKYIDDYLIEFSSRIGTKIEACSIKYGNGDLRWTSYGSDVTGSLLNINICGNSFYEGVSGIGILLSSLFSLTQKSLFLESTNQVLDVVRNSLYSYAAQSEKNRMTSYSDSIGYSGIGGIIYSLVLINRYVNIHDFNELSDILLNSISKELISKDKSLDIISGSAGLIASLYLLIKHLNSSQHKDIHSKALQLISWCADRIISCRKSMDTGCAWKTLEDEPPLNGFAHGSSGISLALIMAKKLLSTDKYDAAISEVRCFEEVTYSHSNKNWIDLRNGSGGNLSWCHGAVGIGGARLLELRNDSKAQYLIKDVNRAINSVLSGQHTCNVDCLCCGEAGAIDFLAEASVWTNDNGLLDEAKQKMFSLVEQYYQTNSLRLFSGATEPSLFPSLFQGSAGIGYTSLRLTDLDKYSSLLFPG